ncbi:hypothetical protein YC2023_001550 [Brassica napus]
MRKMLKTTFEFNQKKLRGDNQQRSRFNQQKLQNCNPEEKAADFGQVLPHAND